jgi:protein TonB
MTQNHSPTLNPVIGASDRLGLTLFLALTIHAIVVLGVGFTYSKNPKSGALPNLDIILANSQSLETVENPDFLAQVDQAGGGKAEEKARPSAPVSANTPLDQLGLSEQIRSELRRNQLQIDRLYFITQEEFQHEVEKYTQLREQPTASKQAADADQRQTQIARLQAEIRQMTINYAKRPKSIILTASTKKAIEASYLASWVQKIEHTGNLNYPQEAMIKNIDGRLRLSVRINAAGEILDVKITRSSGSTVLDEAAKRILQLAEPFAPFSDELKQRADQIVIIRTWEFNSNRLQTEGEV